MSEAFSFSLSKGLKKMNRNNQKPHFVKSTSGQLINMLGIAQMYPTERGYLLLDGGSCVADWQEHEKYDTGKMRDNYMLELKESRRRDVFILNREGFIQIDWISRLHPVEDGLWVVNRRNEAVFLFKNTEFKDLQILQDEIYEVIQSLAKGHWRQVDWDSHRVT